MNENVRTFPVVLFICLLVGLFLVPAAWAADEGGNWRSTYDLILLWVNFALFVFIIFKFARPPLKKFLSGQKETIERRIKQLEEEKSAAEQKIQEMSQAFAESQTRFAELKERIVEQGQKKKQEIIEDARLESNLMIEDARRKIENQLRHARQMIKSELVDAAVDLAIQRLPAVISAEDNHHLVQHYLTRALPAKNH